MPTKTIEIIEVFRNNSDPEYAKRMSAYMKNQFFFLGIPKPKRAELCKSFLKEKKQSESIDWALVIYLFELPEREYQYLALDYLKKCQNQIKKNDIKQLEKLILNKSWWDTVDAIVPLVGVVCMKYPELKEECLQKWIHSTNIWLKRVSIIFQLKYKDQVDTDFLEKAIICNHLTKEFFVNKAIGWALRQYSKFNPDWVRDFLSCHSLSPLSVREGSKYL